MAAGFGGGAGLFIPFIAVMLKSDGYRATFLWTGDHSRSRHPDRRPGPAAPRRGSRPEPAAAKASAAGARLRTQHFTTGEMLRTPQFWMMYLAFVMMATGGLLLTLNAGPIAGSWGIAAGALTRGRLAQRRRQRRQPGVLGLGVGSRPDARPR